jgi:hypothetical protein
MDRKRRFNETAECACTDTIKQVAEAQAQSMQEMMQLIITVIQQNNHLHAQLKTIDEQITKLTKEVSDLQTHAMHGFNMESPPYMHF